ncbi:hypothetical protein GA0061083_0551 [Pseudarthrobacter enclensis]|uniref:Uncharacterized protein n=1 Tax=Pseudarthrobacter enclensis TaxID=993070 RepID=A0A0V8IVE4_9MICC|nr:hypothetical protein [Pseudarthrobacter enclensis]KSU78708.1 hypothetical protein AS031_01270 [Pseudarthrobacter enclensis]SCB75826.1 hypothetical protein GA0061083_0551 [Pseudarthrobacter enclensis]
MFITSVFISAEAAQSALHLAERFLLMVSMTLFVSYVIFMVGALVVSGLLSTGRSVRRRLAHKRLSASGAPQPGTAMWRVGSKAGRHGARA